MMLKLLQFLLFRAFYTSPFSLSKNITTNLRICFLPSLFPQKNYQQMTSFLVYITVQTNFSKVVVQYLNSYNHQLPSEKQHTITQIQITPQQLNSVWKGHGLDVRHGCFSLQRRVLMGGNLLWDAILHFKRLAFNRSNMR